MAVKAAVKDVTSLNTSRKRKAEKELNDSAQKKKIREQQSIAAKDAVDRKVVARDKKMQPSKLQTRLWVWEKRFMASDSNR